MLLHLFFVLASQCIALRYFALDKPGLHVGVVGLGGLGHMAVKFAKAFGAKVTVISTSPNKKEEAIQNLGADSFLISRDQDQMQVLNYIMPSINLDRGNINTHISLSYLMLITL